MQAVSVLSLSPSFNSYDSKNEFEYAQLSANFSSKLKIAGSGSDFEFNDTKPAALDNEKEKPEMEENESVQNADASGDCEKNEDEDDFSFVCTNPDGSPISADDIFQNGQIRPEARGGCAGAQEQEQFDGVVEAVESQRLEAPEQQRRERRVRVPETPNSTTRSPKPSQETADNKSGAKIVKTVEKVKGKAKKAETVSSAHEKHYVMNRAKKEEDKRRSYLPYRQGLVGFFTNVNGLSRNVHPF
ncbi:uncharacterized protein Pyn_11453 [Prunus yedoensis var. nudiflora]|uniref:Uncharacterized protein n=1 Tax=Prunus yedoensis var. nudiflora TaxID=2094558 RepID=A0A314UYX6_PRUYE|nr:uncharacterized protein Pyn_11453 [Prunus yedoensis var. nudiflora]